MNGYRPISNLFLGLVLIMILIANQSVFESVSVLVFTLELMLKLIVSLVLIVIMHPDFVILTSFDLELSWIDFELTG